jgi:hypothetical protein
MQTKQHTPKHPNAERNKKNTTEHLLIIKLQYDVDLNTTRNDMFTLVVS